jgi:butyrate kinase
VSFKLLVINPGATSTKVAVFDDETLFLQEIVDHGPEDLGIYERLVDQIPYRKKLILEALERHGVAPDSFDAVVGRGGLLAPLPGGVYEVSSDMLDDVRYSRFGEHASNLGPQLADDFARASGCRAFIADPVSTDEMLPIARLSGMHGFDRICLFHALNHKAVARRVASEMGRAYEDTRFIVAHMGSGISIGAHVEGRVVDVFDPMNEGTFSGDRTGSLPVLRLVKMCYSGKYTAEEMLRRINGDGGLYSYIGTKDLRRAWEMVRSGDEHVKTVMHALAYQISKDIGAMAAVCCGRVDAIILTGGMAYSSELVELITERISFIAPVKLVPGEEEMGALAGAALRVLRGTESAKKYER